MSPAKPGGTPARRRAPSIARGRCQLLGHGTYERQTPAGVRVRRFRCPRSGQTVSLLPDWLASHRPGTLAEVEQIVRAAEPAAVSPPRETVRGRPPSEPTVVGRVQQLLTLAKGLYPERFCEVEPSLAAFGLALGTAAVLVRLRAVASEQLAALPTPVGFSHRNKVARRGRPRRQQAKGRDPPPGSAQFRDGQAA